jgi:hypothetical protein
MSNIMAITTYMRTLVDLIEHATSNTLVQNERNCQVFVRFVVTWF